VGKSHAIIARGYNSSDDKVVWVNPQSKVGKDAIDNQRSTLENFVGLIGFPMGGVQFTAAAGGK